MNSSNLASENIQLPSITGLSFREETLEVSLSDGRTISVPLAWYPRLAGAPRKQLEHFEVSPGGYGIHWPDLDEDLSVKGFLFP